MEKYLFKITPIQMENAATQLSGALKKLNEIFSHTRYPKLWKLSDKLNAIPKLSEDKLRSRHIRRAVLGIVNWVLGIILIMPGLMDPVTWVLVGVGAIGFSVGVVSLWRHLRKFAGVANLLLGLLLCFGAVGNPEQLGRMLFLGIPALVIGITALIPWKRKKKDPYIQAADTLLSERQKMTLSSLTFYDSGVEMDTTGQKQPIRYDEIVCMVASEDLYLFAWKDGLIILQKTELQDQTSEQFEKFIGQKILLTKT